MTRAATIALMALAACASGPVRSGDEVDPAVYRVTQDPEGRAAWQRAQRALARDDVAAALPDLRLAVTRLPDHVRAHLAYQDAALAQGGEAAALMRTFYDELPARPSPVPAYVKARLFDTSYAKGQALLEILDAYPSFGWAHLSLGRIRRGQGQLLVAVDAFRVAFVEDSSLHAARLERGEALAELGRLAEAAVDYEAYIDTRPEDWVAMREYVTMLIYRLTRIDRALQLLDRLDAAFPGDVELWMHRGAALWRALRPREALPHYLAALEQDAGAARAALDIGLIYYDALPRNEEERRIWWPRARAAFRLFLQLPESGDGQEAFERALAVPYRLGVIEDLLGPDPGGEVTLDDLRLPPG